MFVQNVGKKHHSMGKTATEISVKISGLQVYWTKLKHSKDYVAMAKFREAMGKPAKQTFYKWLHKPGDIPTSRAIEVARFLSKYFGEPIEALDLVKQY